MPPKTISFLFVFFLPSIVFGNTFEEVPVKNIPYPKNLAPAPTIPYPKGAIETTFESHGNHWALAPSINQKNHIDILVLNAKNPTKWELDTLSGLSTGLWRWIKADYHGYVWVSDGSQALRINVRKPHGGTRLLSADSAFPPGKITAMGLGPNGTMLFALHTGKLVEAHQAYDKKARMHKNKISVTDCPKNVSFIYTDTNGTLWLKAKNRGFKKAAPEDAWQHTWEETYHFQGGSHDLSGDVYNGKFYMSWAITGDFGYPSTGNFHRHILEFDPGKGWNIFADYGYPRGYGGTSFLDGKIWASGGDSISNDNKRFSTTETLIFNPITKEKTKGPDLPAPIASAISFNVNDRIYTTGYTVNDKNLKMYSIGIGDSKWTEEINGPKGGGSVYGTKIGNVLYILLAHNGLAMYNTVTKEWSKTIAPNNPRAAQVGNFKGEVWVMGGRNKESEDATYIYNPKKDEWRKGPRIPRTLIWGCAFNIDGDMYLTGGFSYHNPFSHRTFKLRNKNY